MITHESLLQPKCLQPIYLSSYKKFSMPYSKFDVGRWMFDVHSLFVLTSIIQENLKPFLLKTCYHVKGNGGLKGAARGVMDNLPGYKFFCKTDVKSYYDNIDHYTLLMKLHDYIDDRIIKRTWGQVSTFDILKFI